MIQAIIWDLDGVISDTQKLHARVESELLAELGFQITPEEITRRFSGRGLKEQFDTLLIPVGISYDYESARKSKWARMIALVDTVEPIDGSVELIRRCHSSRFRQAVGSASITPYIEKILHKLEIRDCFQAVVGRDMVKEGKPHPEIFLEAAKRLEYRLPKQCVVIEDGVAGMLAALHARMPCIGLVPTMSFEYPCNIQVTSLREIGPSFIRSCDIF